ncbi:hypothetical protein [Actibacterium ureilyticum]|uniref:hypothetical protein n=1 Tax=Actibacterium ureilyticum TaxID=1590614 RepID=UPI001141075E|nr:hypothetical protein [Actibacterium ureilyticum]
MTLDVNKTRFEERLTRIDKGRQWAPEGVVTRDMYAKRAARAKTVKAHNPLANILYPVGILMALLAGLISVLAARYAQFHLLSDSVADMSSDLLLAGEFAMASCVGMVLRMAIAVQGKDKLMAQTVGVWAGIVGLHNLVHLAPDLFTTLFSPGWVASVMASAPFQSILFRGVVFAM